MVGEQFGVIVRAPETFDPRGGMTVFLGARAARQLAVSDVAEQHVPERVLRVAAHRRAALPPDEVLSLQRAQETVDVRGRGANRLCHTAQPEHLALHRRLLQELLLGARQRVDPSCDHALHGFGQLCRRAALRQHAHVLLREERIPAGSLEQRLSLVGREQRAR